MDERKRALVLRVNELFHDLEGRAYEARHPEIFEGERARWERTLSAFLPKRTTARKFLDIGAGTGFVGTLLRPYLEDSDTLTCADLSEVMLKQCQHALEGGPFVLTLLKMQSEIIAIPNAAIDIVTMNSVLHHMPSPKKLIQEIVRILKPGGLLFIGHEPNAQFFRSYPLVLQARFIHHLKPRRVAAAFLKIIGLYDRFMPHERATDPILQRINAMLLREGQITTPLSSSELSQIVDVHSPTAGGYQREKGFDVLHVLDPWKEALQILTRETYGYFPKNVTNSSFRRLIESLLKALLPLKGSTFFLVAKKR